MNIEILKPVDIEEEIRVALSEYVTAYVRPLPEEYALPNTLIAATGGSSKDTIDTFTVSLDTRAETDAEAYDTMATSIGLLQKLAANQVGALRKVEINSLGRWGSDPVRPDLKLCTATVIVTAHRQSQTIPTKEA